MHYKDIADAIVSRKLRRTTATPAQTVAARITTNIKRLGAKSRFARVGRGEFILKPSGVTLPTPSLDNKKGGEAPTPEEADLLTAFGMNWRRELVVWSNTPNLYGQQQRGAKRVNFSGQKGIYLLHDDRDVVYIGRAIDQPVGKRMSDHTTDRLNGRWNRFSWFGILPVREDGTIVDRADVQTSVETIVRLMEALLIESIEAPLNRKRGDDIRAVEYIQVEDEKIRKQQLDALLSQIQMKLREE
jgi:hypothetical protein